MQLSLFGEKFTQQSGILRLMDDMGRALAGSEKKYMLGGGNPAHLPEINAVWRERMEEILRNHDEFERMVANYDTPRGRQRFLEAVAALLNREFGWPVTEKNIAVTNGSQTAFFMLFNLLAGPARDGTRRRILFPLMPEYIGYADQSLDPADFVGIRSALEELDDHTYKYHVDFERLEIGPDIAAICVSRPTNPTGNVLTDAELLKLDNIARNAGIPLIIDNAYGTPFPNIIFTDATPVWNENIILGMSLSKIGLPAVRTGILIASEEVIHAVSSSNAILSLANSSLGQVITEPLLENSEILTLSNRVIKPFYEEKSRKTVAWIHELFDGRVEYAVHVSEGSLFLWLWFKNLKGTTIDLYHALSRRHVIVVPGTYFFFGLEEEWPHRDECIRINYAMADKDVYRGLEIIADEAARLQR